MTTFDPNNLREGVFRLYYGNGAGAAVPATIPDDDEPFGDPGAAWTAIGATQGGLALDGLNPDETAVPADHTRRAFTYFPGESNPTASFSLLETDAEKLYAVSNIGELNTVAAGASTYGHNSFKLTSERRPERAFLAEGYTPDGKVWRVFSPRGRFRISGGMTTQKGQARLAPVVYMSTAADDDEALEIRDVTSPTG